MHWIPALLPLGGKKEKTRRGGAGGVCGISHVPGILFIYPRCTLTDTNWKWRAFCHLSFVGRFGVAWPDGLFPYVAQLPVPTWSRIIRRAQKAKAGQQRCLVVFLVPIFTGEVPRDRLDASQPGGYFGGRCWRATEVQRIGSGMEPRSQGVEFRARLAVGSHHICSRFGPPSAASSNGSHTESQLPMRGQWELELEPWTQSPAHSTGTLYCATESIRAKCFYFLFLF